MKRQKGFTLIELLVVIAIIALLMSILMPTLNLVKGYARDLTCLARVKHWGLIFCMYIEEHNGRFPDGGGNHWLDNRDLMKLAGYTITLSAADAESELDFTAGASSIPLQNDNSYDYGPNNKRTSKMAFCPAATKVSKNRPNDPFTIFENAKSSYGVNLWLVSCGGSQRSPFPERCRSGPGGKILGTRNRAEVPMFMDCTYDPQDECDPTLFHFDQPPAYNGELPFGSSDEIKRVCINRHNGYISCGFLDFHARKVGLKEIWEIPWSRKWFTDRQGNPDYAPPNWAIEAPWMKKFRDYN